MSEFQSENIGELAKALAAAQGTMDAAKKDSKGNYGKYTTISSILEVVKDALSANGLSVVQAPMPAEPGSICLRTTLMHSSGQWIASSLTMRAEANGPQKIGSVITYARRYALAAMLGVGQEDDDAQAVQDAVDRRAQQKPQQQRQAAPARQQAQPAQPQVDDERKARINAIIHKMQDAGFRSKEDLIGELSRLAGRPVQNRSELSLDDIARVEAGIAAGGNPVDSPF